MNNLTFKYVPGPVHKPFDHAWIYEQAERVLSTIDPEFSPKAWNWVRNNFCPIDVVIPHTKDPETGLERKYDIEYVEEFLKEHRDFENSIAFDEIRKYTSIISRTLLIYAGKGKPGVPINLGPGQVQAHTHKPEQNVDGSFRKTRMTATVVMPLSIVEPVTETLCFAWQDIPYETMNIPKDTGGWENSLRIAETYNDRSNVHRIRFPNEGEYLTFYFDSSHYLHWSELETNNEFLCLVHDC